MDGNKCVVVCAAMSCQASEGNASDVPGTMAFMMPSKWSKESLPVPNDSDVNIVEVGQGCAPGTCGHDTGAEHLRLHCL
jgi:hypothetical protein